MFSFGGSEFFIIVIVALLLFGPDKIPQIARTIGRFTREFNKYKSIMESTLNAEIYRAEGETKDTITIEDRIAKAGAASTAFTNDRAAKETARETPEPPASAPPAGTTDSPAPASRPVAAPAADETDEEDGE